MTETILGTRSTLPVHEHAFNWVAHLSYNDWMRLTFPYLCRTFRAIFPVHFPTGKFPPAGFPQPRHSDRLHNYRNRKCEEKYFKQISVFSERTGIFLWTRSMLRDYVSNLTWNREGWLMSFSNVSDEATWESHVEDWPDCRRIHPGFGFSPRMLLLLTA